MAAWKEEPNYGDRRELKEVSLQLEQERSVTKKATYFFDTGCVEPLSTTTQRQGRLLVIEI